MLAGGIGGGSEYSLEDSIAQTQASTDCDLCRFRDGHRDDLGELVEVWQSLDDDQRANLLNIARGLAALVR